MLTPTANVMSRLDSDESFVQKTARLVNSTYTGLDFVAPVAFLLLRFWVAWQFFKSGLTKLDIQNTIFLFQNEYHVPLLPPVLAAYLATGTELICSALLMIGLAARVNALVLFILNIVAVISYADASLTDHLPWGLILLLFVLHGPDKLSADYFIGKHVIR